jgi:asparagine synthase (glutamine-hydrolysing)
MCGIAGIVECDSAILPLEKNLRQMLGMIRHRGPDQFGVYLDSHAGLGNARLSIIDLDGGQQPIGTEDGNLWIVFNGEVFNYVELRAELEARGHRFLTRTDTEVVLHAFEEYGPECLNRFNGQFAFAIWNRRRKEMFLARDRLGVRPLFYTRTGNKLIFASEIKALLAHNEVSSELDLIGVAQVFTYWSTISPRTSFHAIQSVPPGHCLLFRDNRLRLTPYWTLRFPTHSDAKDNRTLEDCVEEFRALLTDAVKLRLRADVPVGAYLSGGLDSSTIAAIIKRLGVTRLETFSIAFDDRQFDESSFQKQMADFLGTEHHIVRATHAEIGGIFPDVIWHTETPVTRTAPGPMFLLSRLVQSRNYKVVLTGEGADEFLGGYDIFKETMIRRFWQRHPESRWRPHLLRRLYPDIAGLSGTASDYIFAFFGKGLETPNDPYFSHAIRWANSRRAERFFSEELKHAMALKEAQTDHPPALPEQYWLWHPLARAQYLEIALFFSQYLLSSQGDRPAMAHSIEGRFPFLDTRVVDFCNHLPPRLKLCGLHEKFLLRRAARDWLPADIVQRGKRPYRAPVHRSFFNGATLDYVDDLLSREAIRDVGLFSPSAVERLAAKARGGGALGETDDMALVGILSTQLLHRLFIEDFRRREPVSDADDVKVIAAFPRGGRFNLKAA